VPSIGHRVITRTLTSSLLPSKHQAPKPQECPFIYAFPSHHNHSNITSTHSALPKDRSNSPELPRAASDSGCRTHSGQALETFVVGRVAAVRVVAVGEHSLGVRIAVLRVAGGRIAVRIVFGWAPGRWPVLGGQTGLVRIGSDWEVVRLLDRVGQTD